MWCMHGVEDFLPKFGVSKGGDFKRQSLEVDLALLGVCVVAVEAIVLEECEVLFGEFGSGFCC